MRLFTSSTSKRLNEVTGFLFLAFGLVILLGLASFHVQDPSWDTASGPIKTLNLTGRIGAHAADLLLQSFGIGAFLFPLSTFALGWKWMRSEDIRPRSSSYWAPSSLFASFCAAAGMIPGVRVFDHSIPLGGVAGIVLADMLKTELNLAGAVIATATGMIVSIYLVSAFTISKLDFLLEYPARWIAILRGKWLDWLEARARRKAARQIERAVRRRQQQPEPAPDQAPSPVSTLATEAIAVEKVARRKKATPTVATETLPWETINEPIRDAAVEDEIPICQLEDLPLPDNDPLPAPAAPARALVAPKIHPLYRLPKTELLNEPPIRTAFDEQELKTTAANVKVEVRRIQRAGQRGADQPGAGGHYLRVQAGSGNQVQPDHSAARGPVLGAAGGIHFD